jgi:GDP-4-dehydro-6-deoxy-D-mannose reductase
MRVLITGAGGFLGGALARRLAAREDIELVTWSRTPLAAFPRGRAIDLMNRRAVAFAMRDDAPDVVVHAAGGAAFPTRRGVVYLDSQVMANVAAALGFLASHARLLLLSSAAHYGASESRTPWREIDPCEPIGSYAEAKALAEHSAHFEADRAGFAVTALRLFNVVAPEPHGRQVFDTFLRKAAAVTAEPPPWRVRMGPLGAVRDFVAVGDVLRAIERVIERDVWDETINVCTGVGRTVRELLQATAAHLPGEVAIEEEDGPAGLDWSVGDPSRCEALLGLRPSSDLEPIVRGAADWIVATAKDGADARSDA